MKPLLALLFVASTVLAFSQGHDTTPADAMKNIAFMKGEWTGKQAFVTDGDPMVGDAVNSITDAIGGRYLEEKLATTLPGRKPSDTRHFITYDPKTSTYKAWWFNDSSVGAMELEGTLTDGKLVLTSKGTPTGNGQTSVFRATYESPSAGTLVYKLELQQGADWRQLFTTTYSKKG
jgi:hypothetical protein